MSHSQLPMCASAWASCRREAARDSSFASHLSLRDSCSDDEQAHRHESKERLDDLDLFGGAVDADGHLAYDRSPGSERSHDERDRRGPE